MSFKNPIAMNGAKKTILFTLFFLPFLGLSQYTDVINSNRPGKSVSAYALGSNVLQAEFGLLYEKHKNSVNNSNSKIFGADLAIRYGLFFEQLEVYWEGTFINDKTMFDALSVPDQKNTDFTRNRLGLKFLIFDPYKNPERNKPNLYSWRANNVFQLKNLIPAVSVYGGANYIRTDYSSYSGDHTLSYRGMIATQSRLTARQVLITNIAYDKISTDNPEWNYLVSFSRAFKNPKWSMFLEHEGIISDLFSDYLFRGGVAYLFSENFQVDLHIGTNIDDDPSKLFGSAGLSYRLDMHKDKLLKENKGKIKKNANKKKDKNSRTKLKNTKKKEKKKKKKDDGVIEF